MRLLSIDCCDGFGGCGRALVYCCGDGCGGVMVDCCGGCSRASVDYSGDGCGCGTVTVDCCHDW